MRKTVALAVVFLSGFTHTLSPLAIAQDANQRASGERAFEQALSPEQKNVWEGEQSLHLFEYQRDFKDYMPLWDAHFVGWPDYVQRPVGKPEIESSTVEEFKREPAPRHPFVAPEPLAIAVFGDVAVTHYFWPEADQTSPTVFRITHTWQRGLDGWHIIGGMSCKVPRSPDGRQTAASADAEQREVLKVSHAWLEAYNRRDLDAFARLTSDDFIGSTDDGIFMTKAALLKRMSTHPSQADQRINVRDVRMRVDGDTAIVNYRLSLTEEGFDNGKLVFELRRTEVFQKKNGTWLAIAAHDSNLPINHREPVKADPKTFKDYAGEYEHFRPGFTVTYRVEGDHLIDEWKGDKIEAFPMGKDTFFEREDLGWTTFVRGNQGRVTGYVYHYADGQLAAGRKIK